jgi:valyl-tRNA synthetase
MMSFISEELWQQLPQDLKPTDGSERSPALIVSRYPQVVSAREDATSREAARGFAAVQELVRGVRTMRSEFTIPPAKTFDVYVRVGDDRSDLKEFFAKNADLVRMLAGLNMLEIGTESERRAGAVAVIGSGFEAYLYVRDLIDVEEQVRRLDKGIGKIEKGLSQAERKLANEGFLAKAKPDVVEAERAKAQDLRDQLERMRAVRAELQTA